jgi:hypothetical protein
VQTTLFDQLAEEERVRNGLARIQREIEDTRHDFDRDSGRGHADTSHLTRKIERLQEQQIRLASSLGEDEAKRLLEGLG